MERVKDMVCIVTGGAMGLGKADAEALAREAGYVIVADLVLDRSTTIQEGFAP